jgi:hypothetical protein
MFGISRACATLNPTVDPSHRLVKLGHLYSDGGDSHTTMVSNLIRTVSKGYLLPNLLEYKVQNISE